VQPVPKAAYCSDFRENFCPQQSWDLSLNEQACYHCDLCCVVFQKKTYRHPYSFTLSDTLKQLEYFVCATKQYVYSMEKIATVRVTDRTFAFFYINVHCTVIIIICITYSLYTKFIVTIFVTVCFSESEYVKTFQM